MSHARARHSFRTAGIAAGVAAVTLLLAASSPLLEAEAGQGSDGSTASWPQWGGPTRNFEADTTTLPDAWPEGGPRVLWNRPLGTGHSAIVVDENRLYTMYRAGNGRARQGPWEAEETVVALDATTGRTLWEHKYPSRREDFSFGAGPHSTPLVVGDRLFTIGTNKQLLAFEKRSGKIAWSHDLIKEFGSPELLIRPVVKTGYGCSPIAYQDTIICSVGGPGQSVMAFRQADGAVVWKSGDFLTSEAPPILIELDGTLQLVFLAGGTITALDPATGAILWSHPHDPGNDLNCGTPIWDPANRILFVSSAYKAGSRAIRLRMEAGVTHPEELWFTNRVRFMFLNALRIGETVYGTSGDFGPAFLTALNLKTGHQAWQHRGFGRASLIHANGKVIIMDEDGDLALARLAPEGATILSQAKIFETTSWTVPTLVDGTLYARDREKIVALSVGERRPTQPSRSALSAGRPSGSAAASATPRPTFAGTWRLDKDRSRIVDGAGLAGLIGAGAPPMLHVTQPANGTLLIESPVNEGHVRMYRPGATTTTSAAQTGTITMTSKWNGSALVSEGTLALSTGATSGVKETLAVSADGNVLSVDVVAAATPEAASALKYTRIKDVGACESWPTPCKR
jgi:outer membrane protein assembly factor BamB